MTAQSEAEYRQERSRTYDSILSLVEAHIEAVPVSLVTDIHTTSATSAQNGAIRESWRLLSEGIRHLKSGAPQGKPGSLPGALEKISVRKSALASGLGIKPPQYVASDEFEIPEFDRGREEALFYSRRLLEAALDDMERSRKVMGNGIATQNAADAFGTANNGPNDAELAKIFEAVMKSKPAADTSVPKQDIADMRRQTVLSFNFLMDAYNAAGEALLSELADLPETPKPKPSTKGQSFDF